MSDDIFEVLEKDFRPTEDLFFQFTMSQSHYQTTATPLQIFILKR